MNTEKFTLVIEYFKDMGITIPTAVRNAIEDVFMENDDVQTVECYHAEDLDQFQLDLKMGTKIEMVLGDKHSGNLNNVWTYYGNIEYSYNENIKLIKDESVEEDISNIESGHDTFVAEPNDWVVTLVEKVSWGDYNDDESTNIKRETTLFIYCPVNSEPEPFENLYRQGGFDHE